MARPVKPAHEVHKDAPVITEAPAEETQVAKAEQTPKAEAPEVEAPKGPKKKTYTVVVGQIQRCVFANKTTWDAMPGRHQIDDEALIANLRDYTSIPGAKRCIDIIENK